MSKDTNTVSLFSFFSQFTYTLAHLENCVLLQIRNGQPSFDNAISS